MYSNLAFISIDGIIEVLVNLSGRKIFSSILVVQSLACQQFEDDTSPVHADLNDIVRDVQDDRKCIYLAVHNRSRRKK